MFFISLGIPMSDLIMLLMIRKDFPENQVGKIFSLRLTISSLGFSLGLVLAAPLFRLVSILTGLLLCELLILLVGVAGVIRFF